MPYMIVREDDQYCVHKENADKTPGEKLKCYSSEADAKDYLAALYAATEGEKMAEKTFDIDLITYGGEVKALEGGKVGGYLVRFSSADDPDLLGEYFTKSTDFGDLSKSPVLYHHGMDRKIGRRKLGMGDLTKDDVGVWIEAQLELRDEYEKFIYEMAQDGKMGWSSGTAAHLVEQKGGEITAWPLGLDASLTPTPAEPRNGAIPIKSLLPLPEGDGVSPEAGDEPINQHTKNERGDTMELTQEQLEALISGAATKAVEEYAKAQPATTKAAANVEVVKDEADQEFGSAGDFFMAVKNAALYPNRADVRLSSKSLKATGLSEGVPADGGYLLNDQVAAGILDTMYGGGEILPRVTNYPIGPNSNGMLFNAVDETSRVDGSRWGGILGYWLEEGGTKTASRPVFRQMSLKLKKVAALAYATDELLADAVALEGWLTRTVPNELRFQAEDAIVEGNGAGKPLGILSSTALVSAVRTNANQVAAADINGMWARRWPGANDYVWLIHPSVYPQLSAMTVGNWPVFLPASGMSGSPYASILGRPVIETEYNPALGTLGDILLASLSQYAIITKGGVQSASSMHVQFLTDEMVYRFVYRVDGEPLWSSAVTPFHGTDTISPFVALAATT